MNFRELQAESSLKQAEAPERSSLTSLIMGSEELKAQADTPGKIQLLETREKNRQENNEEITQLQ